MYKIIILKYICYITNENIYFIQIYNNLQILSNF